MVIKTISDSLLQPDSIELLADAMLELQQDEVSRPDPERESLQQSLADVERKINNILTAIENGTASASLTSRLADLEQQKNTLDFQLSCLSAKKSILLGRDELIFLLQQFRIAPSERTDAYCRRLIDTFVSKIELSNSQLLIYFNISESTENKKTSRSNHSEESSTGMRLVRVARIELTAS